MRNSILFFVMILFLTVVANAQEYRFENKAPQSTETISFELQGNKIVDGEWEHVSDDPNGSGEVYGFTGIQKGNQLLVSFRHTIPYSVYAKTKNAVWLFDKKELRIILKVKINSSKQPVQKVIVFK